MGLFKDIKKIGKKLIKGDVLGAGLSLAGAVIGSKSAKKGAAAQTQSADAAIAEQRRQFDLTRADQQPWMEAGRNALANLSNPAAFQASPDYAFRRDEGQRGIQQTAAARGGAFSGNALKALSEFNSNLASGEFGNWWNRQAGMAGAGQQATNNVGQFGANTAGNIGSALMSAGDARASGIVGSGNALTAGLSAASDAYQYFKKPKQPNKLQANNYTGSVYGSHA